MTVYPSCLDVIDNLAIKALKRHPEVLARQNASTRDLTKMLLPLIGVPRITDIMYRNHRMDEQRRFLFYK